MRIKYIFNLNYLYIEFGHDVIIKEIKYTVFKY